MLSARIQSGDKVTWVYLFISSRRSWRGSVHVIVLFVSCNLPSEQLECLPVKCAVTGISACLFPNSEQPPPTCPHFLFPCSSSYLSNMPPESVPLGSGREVCLFTVEILPLSAPLLFQLGGKNTSDVCGDAITQLQPLSPPRSTV